MICESCGSSFPEIITTPGWQVCPACRAGVLVLDQPKMIEKVEKRLVLCKKYGAIVTPLMLNKRNN